TRRGLPELLRYEDRNSMAHSIEARVPLLDHRLVELAFSLPGGELIRRGETKSVLRRAFADLLPPEVRDRRDKLGFVTPEARFLRTALGELAGDVFSSRVFAERGFVDAAVARRRLERHRRRIPDVARSVPCPAGSPDHHGAPRRRRRRLPRSPPFRFRSGRGPRPLLPRRRAGRPPPPSGRRDRAVEHFPARGPDAAHA